MEETKPQSLSLFVSLLLQESGSSPVYTVNPVKIAFKLVTKFRRSACKPHVICLLTLFSILMQMVHVNLTQHSKLVLMPLKTLQTCNHHKCLKP